MCNLNDLFKTCKSITEGLVIKDIIKKYNDELKIPGPIIRDCKSDRCEITWKPDKNKKVGN